MVSRAVELYRGLDYAFNNAGVAGTGTGTTLLDAKEEDWDNIVDVNLKGVWLCMKYEIPEMIKRGGGAIVNTSAEAGLQGSLNFSFVASKHGVIGLTKSAALGYGNQGIRVNAVCPGLIHNSTVEPFLDDPELQALVQKMEPAGRLGAPEEVAEAAVWLCSEDASFINGVSMPVDGGLTAGRLPRRT
jgi:NAD(P)-dependent dehydrogenase (short-subunit alcohol dehydrogenase family)